MARAYIEWEDGSASDLEAYEWFMENFESLEDFEAKEHPLGFHYPARFGYKDENGAVI